MEKQSRDEGLCGAEEDEREFEESDQIEKSKIGIMRAVVEREDPSAKVVFYLHLCSPSSLIDLALLSSISMCVL